MCNKLKEVENSDPAMLKIMYDHKVQETKNYRQEMKGRPSPTCVEVKKEYKLKASDPSEEAVKYDVLAQNKIKTRIYNFKKDIQKNTFLNF